jgi:hypothetical protein
MEMTMKKLILAGFLAVLAGTPAFAQAYNSSYGTGNIAPNVTPGNPSGAFRYKTTEEINANNAYAQDRTGTVAPRKIHHVRKPVNN